MHLPTPYTIPEHWELQFATDNTLPSLTQQSDAADADINVIVERFTKTGMLPQIQLEKLYGDFTEIGDYKDAMDRMNAAGDEFATIPAEIRKRFGNDPQQFIDFAMNEKNIDQLREWNIAPPKQQKTATLDDAVEAIRQLKPQEKPKDG